MTHETSRIGRNNANANRTLGQRHQDDLSVCGDHPSIHPAALPRSHPSHTVHWAGSGQTAHIQPTYSTRYLHLARRRLFIAPYTCTDGRSPPLPTFYSFFSSHAFTRLSSSFIYAFSAFCRGVSILYHNHINRRTGFSGLLVSKHSTTRKPNSRSLPHLGNLLESLLDVSLSTEHSHRATHLVVTLDTSLLVVGLELGKLDLHVGVAAVSRVGEGVPRAAITNAGDVLVYLKSGHTSRGIHTREFRRNSNSAPAIIFQLRRVEKTDTLTRRWAFRPSSFLLWVGIPRWMDAGWMQADQVRRVSKPIGGRLLVTSKEGVSTRPRVCAARHVPAAAVSCVSTAPTRDEMWRMQRRLWAATECDLPTIVG